MKGIKRAIAVILIINMIFGMVPGLWQKAYADTIPLSVESYSNGKLTVGWNLSGVKSVEIGYHSPDAPAIDQFLITKVVPASGTGTLSSVAIENLKNDYIYDITINMMDANGNSIGSGMMYFMPQISFYGEIVKQQTVTGTGGGSETGVLPALKLSWNAPKLFESVSSSFIPLDELSAFQKLDTRLTRFNYKINISDSVNRTDIDVIWNRPDDMAHAGMYSANVSGDDTRISAVKYDSSSQKYSFYLLGVKDDASILPTTAEIVNGTAPVPIGVYPSTVTTDAAKQIERGYILPDKEILPGTVYYFKINPYPTDDTYNPATRVTGYVDCLSTGPAGSPMLGTFNYVYTPIRFELTKDSMDNVNVKIFKINRGNLSPQLYYEVQLNSIPSDQDSTWNQGNFKDKGKKLDGSYFTGAYAYTVITGVSPNNTVYYRVVVKSNSSNDRIESMKMEYTLKDDVSKPPVPKNVTIVNRQLVTEGEDKSTDVTISWDKPSNWQNILSNTDKDKDVVFHFLLNTNQTELSQNVLYPLEAQGIDYGDFAVKYRLVSYISAKSSEIKDKGNRLEYTLRGFNLFKGEYWQDTNTSGGAIIATVDVNRDRDTDPEGMEYPNFLLPNKTYFLQVYSTTALDREKVYNDLTMSYKSLTTSFTTLIGNEKDVPSPANFKLTSAPTKDTVVLQFDKVKIDWSNYTSTHTENDKIYYDLYMSTRTDANSFKLIGTTEYINTEENPDETDIAFERVNDTQSSFIKATISKFRSDVRSDYFTEGIPFDTFGGGLFPNTTYYFIVKTRLEIPDENKLFPISPSVATVLLPATTQKGEIQEPDPSTKKCLAPIDFSIAKDSKGNPMIGGQTVTFSWTKREPNVKYSLICTTEKVEQNTDPTTINDSLYENFIEAFGNEDNDIDSDGSKFTLDPASPDPIEYFTYDSKTQTYKLTLSKWIFPNKLYYFSLRAEPSGDSVGKNSVWVSIPITTSLIEAPTALAPVNDAELGFYWEGSATAKAEDYKIYLKSPTDSEHKLLTRNQFTVVKKGTKVYGRLFNLKANTSYNIKVLEGNNTVPVYENTGLTTRDDYHQIEVKWKGLPIDETMSYEIAIKTGDAAEYTTLLDSDLEQYMNVEGSIAPYYFEKSAQTLDTSYFMFYAKIKTVAIKLSNGTVVHQPLKSNMKYYIKVRAVKKDPQKLDFISYSKYIGPTDTRTEFSQKDYDDIDEDNVKKATFLDRIAKLEEKLFWRVGMSNTTTSKILLKGDRVVNVLQNSSGKPLMLDISNLGPNMDIDVIYMPIGIAKTLNSENKSLIVKTFGAEYTLRPKTLDIENAEVVPQVMDKQGVKDLFIKVTISRSESQDSSTLQNSKRVSKVQNFEVQVVGSTKTDKQLKEDFHDKVYNDKTGLVKQKTDLMSLPFNNNTGTKEKLNSYIDQLVKETESELSDYINSTVEGVNGSGGMIVAKENIRNFSTPMMAKLTYSEQKGLKFPYALYDGSSSWQKISRDLVYASPNTVTFSTVKTGRYAIFAMATTAEDIGDDHWAKASIDKFTSKYDLSDVFAGINASFNPEASVTVKEIVLVYEKVLNRTDSNVGLDLKQKVQKMELQGIVNTNSLYKDIGRQETAAILMKVYCAKLGVGYDGLKPTKSLSIEDDSSISVKLYDQVTMVVDLGIMKLDDNERFNPKDSVTRAEVISAFVKVLELAGEM